MLYVIAALFFGFIASMFYAVKTGKDKARGEMRKDTINDQYKATKARSRLRNKRSYAKRVREKYTRK